MVEGLQVGIARRIISPPKGIYLIGYGNRIFGNKGIHDDLTATALALKVGEICVVVIACDLLAINEFIVNRVKTILKEDVLICCSHTHSGPIVYADDHSTKKNARYVDHLVSQLSGVGFDAIARIKPATLRWGSNKAFIAVNRRERQDNGTIEIGTNPSGAVDRTIGILQARNKFGQPIANLINFSCHNVVLGPKNRLVSADWAGSMRSLIEKETGVPCLFIQGATADLNPDHEWGVDDYKAVEDFGKKVANSVLEGLENLCPINGKSLSVINTTIWIPLETKAETSKPPDTYKDMLQRIVPIPKPLIDRVLQMMYPWKSRIENKAGVWSVPMATCLLGIGEVIWVALGAEVFNEIGSRIKTVSGSPYTFISSVSNGCIGYLPTEDELVLGGYEVDISPFLYRFPGRLHKNAERITLSEIGKMLKSLSSKFE